MSFNNILLTAITDPAYKYAKAIPSKLCGKRLDPITNEVIDFILESAADGRFVYENDVIELYNEREHRYFMQANRPFILNGLLKQYAGDALPIDLSNIMSDEDVERIASLRTLPAVKKALSEVSSSVTLDRILLMAKHIGRPQSVIALIEQRITEI